MVLENSANTSDVDLFLDGWALVIWIVLHSTQAVGELHVLYQFKLKFM